MSGKYLFVIVEQLMTQFHLGNYDAMIPTTQQDQPFVFRSKLPLPPQNQSQDYKPILALSNYLKNGKIDTFDNSSPLAA
jgi:hypothetical protein